MKVYNVVILVFLFLFVSAFAADKKEGILGGWTPIKNINDPHVVEIAQFAVTQYGKQSGKKLSFVKTIKGETQVVSGTNYRLVLTANDGSNTQRYEAVVLEKPWIHFKNLTSFKPLVLVGGWTPIKNINDPHVKEIAQFAVTQYEKQSGKKLSLVKTIKGETQVVSGTNYRLILTANDGSNTQNYEAIVLEKPWIHFKNLTSFKPLVLVGGWTPIKNINDPHVKEIAQFAVTQYEKQSGKKLSLVKTIKGETQVVSGTNYRLVLTVNDGSNTQNYEAVVLEKPWIHFKNLTSFKPLVRLGGWTPIKNISDPHVVEIAQFAVTQYDKQSGNKLSLVKIIKGYTQVVSGTNYRLVLTAKDGFHTQNYDAIVWEKPWIHFRNLTSFNPLLG